MPTWWILEEDGSAGDMRGEIAIGGDGDLARTGEPELDFGRVGSGIDDEIVFELLGVAVVNDVDAGEENVVLDAAEVGDPGLLSAGVGAGEVDGWGC